VAQNFLCARHAVLRRCEGGDTINGLAAGAQWLTAGGEKAHAFGVQECLGGAGRRIDQVLAIVQDEQHVFFGKGRRDHLQDRFRAGR